LVSKLGIFKNSVHSNISYYVDNLAIIIAYLHEIKIHFNNCYYEIDFIYFFQLIRRNRTHSKESQQSSASDLSVTNGSPKSHKKITSATSKFNILYNLFYKYHIGSS
jgi:hypothetical protein